MCRQVEEQWIAESLQLLHVPQVQLATNSRLACNSVPAPTHLHTPACLHDAVTTYMSSPDQALMEPMRKISSFPSKLMPSTLVKSLNKVQTFLLATPLLA